MSSTSHTDTGESDVAPERRFKQSLLKGHCFLCGSSHASTKEHIFPQWLLSRYSLHNEQLILLNGSSIPYRSLTLPCCVQCNRDFLGPLEESISRATSKGNAALRLVPDIQVVIWLAKIIYGVLRKEHELVVDQKAPLSETILSLPLMDALFRIHDLLQYVRHPFVMHGRPSYSLFRLTCLCYGDARDFDFIDLALRMWQTPDSDDVTGRITPAFGIRMSECGLVISLDDGGEVEDMCGHKVVQFADCKLHPLQFAEVCLRICYNRSRLINSGEGLTIYENGSDMPSTIIRLEASAPGASNFDEHQPALVAALLTNHMRHKGYVIEYPFEGDVVGSLLEHPDGTFRELVLEDEIPT